MASPPPCPRPWETLSLRTESRPLTQQWGFVQALPRPGSCRSPPCSRSYRPSTFVWQGICFLPESPRGERRATWGAPGAGVPPSSLTWVPGCIQRGFLEALAVRKPVLCAPKAVMKTLMTTVKKTKTVATLLSWLSRHCFSTSFRFSRAAGKWSRRKGQRWGHSTELPPQHPPEFGERGPSETHAAEIQEGGRHRAEMPVPSPSSTWGTLVCFIPPGFGNLSWVL